MTRALPDTDIPFSIKQLRAIIPEFDQLLDRQYGDDYDCFIKVLYEDLDDAIRHIEGNRDARQGDTEDRTTEEIAGFLFARGYLASHDSMRSGHCDLTVANRYGFEWLGEAKKHSDYDYLWGGFKQLTTRYSTATPSSSSGGMLIYIRTEKPASDVMSEWRSRLGNHGLPEYSDTDCGRRKGLTFYSIHKHEVSGLPYTVRHMGVLMKFDPKDRKPKKPAVAKGAVIKKSKPGTFDNKA